MVWFESEVALADLAFTPSTTMGKNDEEKLLL